MTIALGILATDGIVLAADTQETVERYWKGDGAKISALAHWTHLGGDVEFSSDGACVVTGTGDVSLLRSLSQRIVRAFNEDHATVAADVLQDKFERVIGKFFGRNIVPYAASPTGSGDDLQIIVAYERNNERALWASRRAALTQATSCAVGIGSLEALGQLRRIGGVHELTTAEAIAVAGYAVFSAKSCVDGCGLDTDIRIVQRNRFVSVPRTTTQALDEQFREFEASCARVVMRHAIAGVGPGATAEDVARVRAAIQRIVSDVRLATSPD